MARGSSAWLGRLLLSLVLIPLVSTISKNFVNSSMPEMKPVFQVIFDTSKVICQHSSDPSDIYVHEISILCDGKPDCYSNPAIHDESFKYCERKCNSTCSDRGACLYDGEKSMCYCNSGFSGPMCEVVDVNECLDKPCHLMAHCRNTPGSYICQCDPGFHGDGYQCADIDECSNEQTVCQEHAKCVNLPGTYWCNCTQGFVEQGSALQKRCVDINECEMNTHNCKFHEMCQNTEGGFSCVSRCSDGYEYLGGECIDVDECRREDVCHRRAECINLPGSYSCTCDAGWTGDGKNCLPIADCTQSDDVCDRHAYCFPGIKRCECQAGYTGDGFTCYDVNECVAQENLCEKHEDKRCVNVDGGYICCGEEQDDERCIQDQGAFCSGGCGLHAFCANRTCQCLQGFAGDANKKCLDVDECARDNMCTGVGQWCVNRLGGYLCCGPDSKEQECQETYILKNEDGSIIQHNGSATELWVERGGESRSSSGGSVVIGSGDIGANGQIPSISNNSRLPCVSFCRVNSECIDGYCECKKGYGGNPNSGCEDIDECLVEGSCPSGDRCVNTEGGFNCCNENSSQTDCVGLEISALGGMRLTDRDSGETVFSASVNESSERVLVSEQIHEVHNFSDGGLITLVRSKVKSGESFLTPESGETGLEISGHPIPEDSTEPSLPERRTTINVDELSTLSPIESITLPGVVSTLGGASAVTMSIPISAIPVHKPGDNTKASGNGTDALIIATDSGDSEHVEGESAIQKKPDNTEEQGLEIAAEGSGQEHGAMEHRKPIKEGKTTGVEDEDMLKGDGGSTAAPSVEATTTSESLVLSGHSTPEGHINVRITTAEETTTVPITSETATEPTGLEIAHVGKGNIEGGDITESAKEVSTTVSHKAEEPLEGSGIREESSGSSVTVKTGTIVKTTEGASQVGLESSNGQTPETPGSNEVGLEIVGVKATPAPKTKEEEKGLEISGTGATAVPKNESGEKGKTTEKGDESTETGLEIVGATTTPSSKTPVETTASSKRATETTEISTTSVGSTTTANHESTAGEGTTAVPATTNSEGVSTSSSTAPPATTKSEEDSSASSPAAPSTTTDITSTSPSSPSSTTESTTTSESVSSSAPDVSSSTASSGSSTTATSTATEASTNESTSTSASTSPTSDGSSSKATSATKAPVSEATTEIAQPTENVSSSTPDSGSSSTTTSTITEASTEFTSTSASESTTSDGLSSKATSVTNTPVSESTTELAKSTETVTNSVGTTVMPTSTEIPASSSSSTGSSATSSVKTTTDETATASHVEVEEGSGEKGDDKPDLVIEVTDTNHGNVDAKLPKNGTTAAPETDIHHGEETESFEGASGKGTKGKKTAEGEGHLNSTEAPSETTSKPPKLHRITSSDEVPAPGRPQVEVSSEDITGESGEIETASRASTTISQVEPSSTSSVTATEPTTTPAPIDKIEKSTTSATITATPEGEASSTTASETKAPVTESGTIKTTEPSSSSITTEGSSATETTTPAGVSTIAEAETSAVPMKSSPTEVTHEVTSTTPTAASESTPTTHTETPTTTVSSTSTTSGTSKPESATNSGSTTKSGASATSPTKEVTTATSSPTSETIIPVEEVTPAAGSIEHRSTSAVSATTEESTQEPLILTGATEIPDGDMTATPNGPQEPAGSVSPSSTSPVTEPSATPTAITESTTIKQNRQPTFETETPLEVTTLEETSSPLTATLPTKESFALPISSTSSPASLAPSNTTKCTSGDQCGDDAQCERRTGACRCYPGFEGAPPQTPCEDVDECALGLHNCHPSSRCHNFVGGYACFCPMGYRKNEHGVCIDIDECAESIGACCSNNGTCVNNQGSYKCQCKPGFTGDGYLCMPLEKRGCSDDEWSNSGCGHNHICMVDGLGKSDCDTCKMGYTMVNGVCTDINECEIVGLHMCDRNANCNNLLGTYACQCKDGFRGDGYMCEDIDECLRSPCHPQAQCDNTPGSFNCTCPEGFKGDGVTDCTNPAESSCNDVLSFCGRVNNTACLSVRVFDGSLGSICECDPNYRLNPETHQCEDIDECKENRHNCDPASSECVNEDGGFRCECSHGYEGVGGVCVDVDECERGLAGCHAMAMCSNHPGSCGCKCMHGFTGDGVQCNSMIPAREVDNSCNDEWTRLCRLENKTCHVDEEDVPECGSCIEGHHPVNGTCPPFHGTGSCADPSKNKCDKNAECIDVNPGSHFCSCKIGYIGDGARCDDIDECSLGGICAPHASCRNQPGSFECTCNEGFTGDGFQCTKSNGTESPNCHLNAALCHEKAICAVDGTCKCIAGFEGNGTECIEATTGPVPPSKPANPTQSRQTSTPSAVTGGPPSMTPPAFETNEPTPVETAKTYTGTSAEMTETSSPSTATTTTRTATEQPTIMTTDDDLEVHTDEATTPAGVKLREGRCSAEDRSNCHELAICEISTGTCRCKDGFDGDGYTSCSRASGTDCVSNSSVCHPSATCDRHSRRCVCPLGHIGDGILCSPDPRDCVLRKDLCSTEAICSGRRCKCIEGFTGDGVVCASLHQRSSNCSECDSNANCDHGTCQCNVGYFGNGMCCVADPRDCVHFPGVCHPDARCDERQRKCTCAKGYEGDGISCFPQLSCRSNPSVCHKEALCDASGQCFCKDGYTGNGHHCQKSSGISHRESLSDIPSVCQGKCDPISELCLEGQCSCKHGFEKRDGKCIDIDECAASPCHRLASCHNRPGSYSCGCPEGYAGDGKACVEHLKLGELGVYCEPDGMTLVLANDTELFEGRMFVRGQEKNPHCTKSFSALQQHSRPYTFKVEFKHCNVRLEDKDTFATTVIVQKHPMFITSSADAYDLKCTYPVGGSEVVSHVNVSELASSSTLHDEADGPFCQLSVTNELHETINAATVGQALRLRLEVSPNDTYSVIPRNCFAINIETAERYSLTDKAGCAIDDQLFPEWTRVRPSLTEAVFRTFKWPDSSLIRFRCDCSACVGDCPPVNCARRREAAMRRFRFRRAHALEEGVPQMEEEEELEQEETLVLMNQLVDPHRMAFSSLMTVHEEEEEIRAQKEVEQWKHGVSKHSEVLSSPSIEPSSICLRSTALLAAILLLLICIGILFMIFSRRRSALTKDTVSLDTPISVISY